jgi:hypothetical protein
LYFSEFSRIFFDVYSKYAEILLLRRIYEGILCEREVRSQESGVRIKAEEREQRLRGRI